MFLSMFDFQKLTVYLKAKTFHIACKTIMSRCKLEKYVNDQLGRASYSIVLNIAEGSAKTSNADRKNYFTTARGSTFECVAVLDLLKDEHIIDEETYQIQISLANEISKLLYTIIKNLSA
jgi:four helix bundle protein